MRSSSSTTKTNNKTNVDLTMVLEADRKFASRKEADLHRKKQQEKRAERKRKQEQRGE